MLSKHSEYNELSESMEEEEPDLKGANVGGFVEEVLSSSGPESNSTPSERETPRAYAQTAMEEQRVSLSMPFDGEDQDEHEPMSQDPIAFAGTKLGVHLGMAADGGDQDEFEPGAQEIGFDSDQAEMEPEAEEIFHDTHGEEFDRFLSR